MNKVEILNFYADKDRVGYFVLENESMDPALFTMLVHEFVNFSKVNDGKGATSFEVLKQDRSDALHVIQNKVPNVIKYLVNKNDKNIEIKLTGLNPNREVVTKNISKPLDINQVLELVPCYHPVIQKSINNDSVQPKDSEKLNQPKSRK